MRSMLTATLIFVATGAAAQAQLTPPSTAGARPKQVATVPVRPALQTPADTANAMAHTPFFKAGIAGDGNFNRTLTPMSFQTERRSVWDARETYLEMSPLLWANRVNGALLMYHGMDDANVGTNPINSQHLFMALDGLGKPAALYMYPYEGHGPLARETTLDLWARWTAWLDTYVKNPPKKK